MTCIQSIFNLLDCQENEELLGTQGVTELNMMTFMGIIEERINELLQANTYIMNGKQFDERENNKMFAEKLHFGHFFGGATSMQQYQLSGGASAVMNLTNGSGRRFSDNGGAEEEDDDDEEDEEDEKPMGIEEFKARVMNGKKAKR